MKDVLSGRTGVRVEELWQEEAILDFENEEIVLQIELLKSNSRLGSLIILLGVVHTRDESPQDRLRVV